MTKAQAQTIKLNPTTLYYYAAFTMLSLFLYCALVTAAHASGINSVIGTALCTVVQMIYGNLGRALATLAIMVIGIGATLGKVSWGLAMTVAVGVAVIFQAGNLVTLLNVGVTGIVINNCN